MPMIKHILFPYDFSSQAMLAAPYVRAMAERFGASITLIGVAPPVWVPTSGEMPVLVEVESDAREKDLRSRLDRALHPEFAGLSVSRVVAVGEPAAKITGYAQANAVDLIMIPTHGFGIFRRMLLGSVTAKVLHDAKCPVWTAAHAEEQRAATMPRTIVCAIDGPSDETAVLVRWAAEFSKTMRATLKLLHVVPPISDWIVIPSEVELHAQLRKEAQAKLEIFLKQATGLDTTVRAVVGRVAQTIAEEAKQEGASLILTGRGAANAAMGPLRSQVYAIIQESACPVLSV